MAERRDNSLLFSLKELRQIEGDRVKQEEDAEKARIDGEKRALEEAELRSKQEVERKKREEEDRVLRMQSEKERQLREEQLRLEAEKHRAQVEAGAKLEEARIHAEMHVKAAEKKAPLGIIFGSIGGVVLLAAGAVFYMFLVVIPERDLAAKQEADRQVQRIQGQFKEQQAQFDRQQLELKTKLAATTDAVEKARLEAQMKANEAAASEAKRTAAVAVQHVAKPKAEKKPGEKKLNCDPNTDPLCGSNL